MSLWSLLLLSSALLLDGTNANSNITSSDSALLVEKTSKTSNTDQTPLRDNSPNCTCYAIDSDNTTDYFLYHRFYDFRILPLTVDAKGSAPPIRYNSRFGTFNQVADPGTLNSTNWNFDWDIQSWGKDTGDDAPVAMQNSPNNVYITKDNQTEAPSPSNKTRIDPPSNYVVLRTVRMKNFQSIAEIDNNQKNLMHASLRFRARVRGAPGAVAGLFTYFDDNNESDIEILTSDPPTTYRYTNQPSVRKGNDVAAASRTIENLPSWTEWRDHRIDWLPHVSRWFIDGQFIVENNYSVPRKPSGLVLNMWSNGGEWSQNMTVGKQAQLQIQWIQVAFNTSGNRDGPGKHRGGKRSLSDSLLGGEDAGVRKLFKRERHCTTVCAVDGVSKVGYPEIRYVDPKSAGSRVRTPLSIWIVCLMVSVLYGL